MGALPAENTERGVSASRELAFRFVQELAAELSMGKVELPSFPDVAMRVQRALSDPNVAPERLVRIVGCEPVLAGRVMRMANSAALNVSGRPAADLRTAITRLGFDMLRGAAMSFAMAQLRRAPELKGLEKPLSALWQRSVSVAAVCYAFARRHTQVNSDTAMLAGLLHGVGKLYILVRAHKHPELFADPSSYQAVVREWHAGIGKALLENWEMSEEISQAVADHEDLERESRGGLDLTDVLTAGTLLASHQHALEMLEVHLQRVRCFTRLGLARTDCETLLEESASEMQALMQALGD